MSRFETYVKLQKPIVECKETLDELEISVDYEKSGISAVFGEQCNSGVYVYIKPCKRTKVDENFTSVHSIFIGSRKAMGMKTLAVPSGRRSDKKIEFVANMVLPSATTSKLAELYEQGEYNRIANLIHEICK